MSHRRKKIAVSIASHLVLLAVLIAMSFWVHRQQMNAVEWTFLPIEEALADPPSDGPPLIDVRGMSKTTPERWKSENSKEPDMTSEWYEKIAAISADHWNKRVDEYAAKNQAMRERYLLEKLMRDWKNYAVYPLLVIVTMIGVTDVRRIIMNEPK